MITRYQVSFEDRLIEPSDHGRWVKFDDVAQISAHAEAHAEEMAQAIQEREREELRAKTLQIVELVETKDRFSADLQAREAVIHRQHELIKAAKDRLELLGHSPTCASRYHSISAEGNKNGHSCNCGLNDWFRESGLHG